MKKLYKKKTSFKLPDAFRVEALEPRVLLSADPIIGVASLLLPDDTQHDHVALDAYHGGVEHAAAPPDSAASHALVEQMLSAAAGRAPATQAVAEAAPADQARPEFAVDSHVFAAHSSHVREGFMQAEVVLAAAGATAAPVVSQAILDGNAGTSVSITPLDPGATIVIANGAGTGMASGQDTVRIDSADLAHNQDGVDQLVIGNGTGHHLIYIGDSTSTEPVALTRTLYLRNPELGGEIFFNSATSIVGSLLIDGSGHTTTYSADFSTTDDILVNDTVAVNGSNIVLTAGSDGSGNMQLGYTTAHMLKGNGDATADSLILKAPGNISIGGAVGASSLNAGGLNGLTITGVMVNGVLDTPDNVTFNDTVTLTGDLLIDASGTVTFTKLVTLTNGAKLSVSGATQVVFQAGVQLTGGGDIFIEGNEINFTGGAESVYSNGGTLTLRPSTVGLAIELGSPPNSSSADTLNLDNTELATFADGFAAIVIGHQTNGHATAGAGTVRIGAINAVEQPTLRDNLQVYGASITVEDYSSATQNNTLLVTGTIKLDAVNNIDIFNQVEANNGGTLASLTLYSANGAINQADKNADGVVGEPIRASSLDAQAALGINLPFTELTSVSAQNTGASGAILIHETAAGGDLIVTSMNQSNPAGSGGIDVSTMAGSITLPTSGSGMVVGGTGGIAVTVAGVGKLLTINDVITSTAGAITLHASGAIVNTDDALNDGLISSSGGAISLQSASAGIAVGGDIVSAGGLVSLQAQTTINMVDGKKISALNAADTGAVSLLAGTSMALSLIEADGSIVITAQSGAISDNLSGNGANLDGDTASATLTSATGIGSAAAPLITRLAALSVNNTMTGNVFIRELTGLRVLGATLVGSGGNLALVTTDGGLAVAGAVTSTATTGAVGQIGNILLQTGNAGAGPADLLLQAGVTTSAGSISLVSASGITLDDLQPGSAPTVRTLAGGQSVDLTAAAAITFEGLAQLATNNGNLRVLSSAGDITLGVLAAGTGNVSLRAGGALLDAQSDDSATRILNVTAAQLRLEAASIGGAAPHWTSRPVSWR